jgi:hypothetical protein
MEASGQMKICDIPLPSSNFKRVITPQNSFARWLRELCLDEVGTPVYDYRGNVFKSGQDSIVAYVVNWDIKGRRLEQCMDILVRMYAEFIWSNKAAKDLGLPLPGGNWLYWEDWREGFRPKFTGIQVTLKRSVATDSSYFSYIKYLNLIFAESHTQQFYHSYKKIDRGDLQIGDFVVRKGLKGHAVMIVDLAENANGELIGLIGNGDTPACQFFILNYIKNQPWIPLSRESDEIPLPLRRTMTWDGLRRFTQPTSVQ